jgi:hypothetical protein
MAGTLPSSSKGTLVVVVAGLVTALLSLVLVLFNATSNNNDGNQMMVNVLSKHASTPTTGSPFSLSPTQQSTNVLSKHASTPTTGSPFSLSPTQQPTNSMDIVLAYYDHLHFHKLIHTPWELWYNLTTLRSRNARYVVYNKSPRNESEVRAEFAFPVDAVLALPNVGREGHTFMHHIVNKYEQLAAVTWFCQENPHGSIRMAQRLEKYLGVWKPNMTVEAGFISLTEEFLCGCTECIVPLKSFLETYVLVTGLPYCVPPFVAALKGCFAVSRKRVLAKPKSLYVTLLAMLEAGPDHPIYYGTKKEYRNQAPVNSMYGHVIERLWSVIFNCSSADGQTDKSCNHVNCMQPQVCFDEV